MMDKGGKSWDHINNALQCDRLFSIIPPYAYIINLSFIVLAFLLSIELYGRNYELIDINSLLKL